MESPSYMHHMCIKRPPFTTKKEVLCTSVHFFLVFSNVSNNLTHSITFHNILNFVRVLSLHEHTVQQHDLNEFKNGNEHFKMKIAFN